MYLDFYNLREEPFGVTPDPKYLYLSPTHREALASLVYGIKSGRGFMALLAEPGMGKTTLLFSLLERLRDSARTAFLFHTQCNSLELLRHLLSDLGIDTGTHDPGEMHQQLNKLLVSEAQAGRKVVAIIDEAQNLTDEALESLRLLSNFETPSAKLLQIILSGQPRLGERLAGASLRQLYQRLSVISHLEPFSPNETYRYIDHRVSIAGSTGGELFDSEARTLIAAASEGIPRNVNKFCFAALSLGCAMGKKTVDGSTIREAIADFDIASLSAGGFHARGSGSPSSPARKNESAPAAAPRPSPLGRLPWVERRKTTAAVRPSEQDSADDSQPAPTKLDAAPFSPVPRSSVGSTDHGTDQAPALGKDVSEIWWGGTEGTLGSSAAPSEPAEDLPAKEQKAEARPPRRGLRVALLAALIILVASTALRFLWNPIGQSQTMASLGKQLGALNTKVREGVRKAPPATSKVVETAAGQATGQLLVDSNPPGARITLDGETRGTWITPHSFQGVPEGDHRISLSKTGYEARERTAKVENGRMAQVRPRLIPRSTSKTTVSPEAEMTLPPSGTGLLKVETTPPITNIYIDGKFYGPSPVEARLSIGPHTYRAELAGYIPYEKTVSIEDGMISTREVKFGEPVGVQAGAVRILTTPPQVSISVDGVARGTTPRAVNLAPGTHRLVLSLPGYQSVNREISVQANQILLVSTTMSLLAPPQTGKQPAKPGEQATSQLRSGEDQE